MARPRIYPTAAYQYKKRGWEGPLPITGAKGKVLQLSGVSGQDGRWPTEDQIQQWCDMYPDANLALRLPEHVVGIDVDHHDEKYGMDTIAQMEAELGELPATWRSTSRGEDNPSGIRFYRVPVEAGLKKDVGPDVELIRYGHRYAIVWPSWHPDTRAQYRWYHPLDGETDDIPSPDDFPLLPRMWVERLQAPARRIADGGGERKSAPVGTHIPAGSRENMIAQYAGYVAKWVKRGLDRPEAEALVTMFHANVDQLPGDEVPLAKALDMLDRFISKEFDSNDPTPETGGLGSGGDHMVELVKVKDGEGGSEALMPTTNFDLRVIGVHVGDDQETSYRLQVRSQITGEYEAVVDAEAFSSDAQMSRWLTARRLSFFKAKRHRWLDLSLYLSSQEAPRFETVPYLGWHDKAQGFVTFEGMIQAGKVGIQPSAMVPNKRLQAICPTPESRPRYGFEGTQEEAIATLKEVLTYHDEDIMSVYGAWWAATLIRPQLRPHTGGFFPYMAIEAVSESGKTTGALGMLLQMGGLRAHGDATFAASRNRISLSQSLATWLDDLGNESWERFKELLRLASDESQEDKMAENRTTVEVTKLVGPVVVSAEGLPGVKTEKAHRDRSILLHPPTVKERPSQRGDYLQWEDVQATRQRYDGDLTKIAGWMVKLALENASVADLFNQLKTGRGRHGTKLGILRVGAHMLARITDDPSHLERVEAWIEDQAESNDDNALTAQILPTALRVFGWTDSAHNGVASGVSHSPVIVRTRGEERRLGVNPDLLAEWLSVQRTIRVDERLRTVDSLRAQLQAAGATSHGRATIAEGGRIQVKVTKVEAGKTVRPNIYYWNVPPDVTELMIARSEGSPHSRGGQQVLGGEDGREDSAG